MKEIQHTSYQCETCRKEYETAEAARLCENKEVTHDRYVKVGDEVTVTVGDGVGKWCKVTLVGVLDREWGHHAWERYWHTVFLVGNVQGGGTRMLLWDQYEPRKC
jgi:hypothetical protein